MMLDQDEINKLMAQANEIEEETPQEEVANEEATEDNTQLNPDEIANLLDNQEEEIEDDTTEVDLEALNEELADIEKEPVKETPAEVKEEVATQEEHFEIGSESWVAQKIRDSHLPYPVEPEHKVVDQLSQVTADGELKAGEVFDAMLDTTERLAHIDSVLAKLTTQSEDMEKVILALQKKFPNLAIFEQKANDITSMKEELAELKEDSANATLALYKAMETMQYQDISRQKIERVISVVKKLSEYLNHVFDDQSCKKEIKVAKHIHGDESNSDALASEDDINAMIEQFSKTDA